MKAGCQPYWNKFNIAGIQFCKNGTMLKRYTQERNKASMMYRNELIEASKCPMPCSFMEYKVSTEMCRYILHAFNTINTMQVVENPSIAPNPKNTMSSISLIFDPAVTVLKEQESYPILSFVADTGGILGLFIGFNFLMVWDGILWSCKKIYNYCVNLYQ